METRGVRMRTSGKRRSSDTSRASATHLKHGGDPTRSDSTRTPQPDAFDRSASTSRPTPRQTTTASSTATTATLLDTIAHLRGDALRDALAAASLAELLALRDMSRAHAHADTIVRGTPAPLPPTTVIDDAAAARAVAYAADLQRRGDFLGAAAFFDAGDGRGRSVASLQCLLVDAIDKRDALRMREILHELRKQHAAPLDPQTVELPAARRDALVDAWKHIDGATAAATTPTAAATTTLTARSLIDAGSARLPAPLLQAVDALKAHHARMSAGRKPPPKHAEAADKLLYDAARAEMVKFRTSLFASGKRNEDDARMLSSTPSLDALFATKAKHIARESIRQALAEVAQLWGPAPLAALAKIVRADRSHVKPESGVMGLADIPDVRDLVFHESAHLVEYFDPALAAACAEFRDRRATGPAAPLLSLVNPNEVHEYAASEQALPDSFVHPYVGVVCEGERGTEVLATGFERFSAPGWMVSFLEADPEHFALIVGALSR